MAKQLTGRRAWAKLLEHSRTAVYLVDSSRCIAYANPACLRWLGVTDQELIGRQCVYGSRSGDDPHPTADLGPPPEVFAGYAAVNQVSVNLDASAEVCSAFHLPIMGPDGEAWVMVIVGLKVPTPVLTSTAMADARKLHERVAAERRRNLARSSNLMLGSSVFARRLRTQVEAAQGVEVPVLIVGPSGSGHELITRAIQSGRRARDADRIVPLDCALLDAELLEVTIEALHVGARDSSVGGRTSLTLLNVDQLHASAQRMLANLLGRDEFRKGVLATARKDLCKLGDFDRELAYALSSLVIELPALRDRLEDLPLMIQAEVEQQNREGGRQLEGVSREAMDQLKNHPWTGNFCELREVVAAAHQSARELLIQTRDLPEILNLTSDAEQYPHQPRERVQLDEYLEGIERELMLRALRATRGNRAEAARLLGISRARLLRRIDALDLKDDPS